MRPRHTLCLAMLPCLLMAGVGGANAAAREVDTFPALTITRPLPAADSAEDTPLPACADIRALRVDELESPWREAVERIRFDCQDLSEEESSYGAGTAATEVVAYLKPGKPAFAGLPLIEVRMKDSELWGDPQFILALPYAEARPTLGQHMETTCGRTRLSLREHPLEHACQIDQGALQIDDGIYMRTGELGGIWVHADESDRQHTVYAVAWSD